MRASNQRLGKNVATLIVLAAIEGLLAFLAFRSAAVYIDSPSYLSAWTDCISHGVPDRFRTPVYPLFLGLTTLLAGRHYITLALLMQEVFLLFSIYFFHKCCRMLFKSDNLAFWLTAFLRSTPFSTSGR